jgi:hypothetical protein
VRARTHTDKYNTTHQIADNQNNLRSRSGRGLVRLAETAWFPCERQLKNAEILFFVPAALLNVACDLHDKKKIALSIL